jgi:hypothetical protein
MSLFRYEEELREALKKWVTEQGFEVFCEVPVCGKIPDVLGAKDGIIRIAIEMKLSNWKRAIEQAFVYEVFANRSYIAMPENKKRLLQKNISEFNRWGIGILIVCDDKRVEVLHHPKEKKVLYERRCSEIIDREEVNVYT